MQQKRSRKEHAQEHTLSPACSRSTPQGQLGGGGQDKPARTWGKKADALEVLSQARDDHRANKIGVDLGGRRESRAELTSTGSAYTLRGAVRRTRPA